MNKRYICIKNIKEFRTGDTVLASLGGEMNKVSQILRSNGTICFTDRSVFKQHFKPVSDSQIERCCIDDVQGNINI